MVASVNRRALALAGLVLLSVAAMSMAAATLTSATGGAAATNATIGPDPVTRNSSGAMQDSNGTSGLYEEDRTRDEIIRLAGCNDLLASLPGSLAYFGALVAVLYVMKRRFSLGVLIFGAYAILPVALAVYFLRTDCVSAGGGRGGPAGNLTGALQQAPPGPEVSGPVMLGIIAVLFVGVAAAVFFSSGEREYVSDEEDEQFDGEADVEDIAAAAANAADRLEARNADVDNEVYRAWWEMTQLLDVTSPETHTPGEFAEAAVDLGIDEQYVDPLTTLFEEVRYGHRDAESREQRAIDVFRAIEDEYGTDAGGGVDRNGDGEAES